MIIPVILAGGSGSRLWPMSRALYPKQLIDIYNDHTMLQNTLYRLDGIEDLCPPLVICNEAHRFMTAEQLRQIGVSPGAIILEPEGKNTAPAIALAALHSFKEDEDPVLLVLPADHVIADQPAFLKTIERGMALAGDGRLVTFGIVPSAPATGYGYIRMGSEVTGTGAFDISAFVEKPDLKTAVTYVDSGQFCWNSGMFMFRASAILKELEAFAPESLALCRTALDRGETDLDFFRLDKEAFEAIVPDSLDYAVMEKTDKGVVIPLDAGWNDLGSFDALWETGEKDSQNNVVSGDVLVHGVTDTFIHAETRLVTAIGLDSFVIVETADAVLVAPREKVQEVKQIVGQLKEKDREEALTHRRVYRPWGNYETIDQSHRYQVKRITVHPGAKLSLQKHYHRAEHWTVVSGTAMVTRGKEEILLKEDESIYIPLGELHRMENPGKIPLELIEVQSGPYLGEDDIVRFEDVYGRKKD